MALILHRRPSLRVLKVGSLVGLALAAGYLSQTVGLNFTSPGTAGLLTGLFVVFTPVLERSFGRQVPRRTVVAVLVALLGTLLLTGFEGGGAALGEALVVISAAAFALQIVLLGRWAPGLPPADLALVQLAVTALVFVTIGGLGGATHVGWGALGAAGFPPPGPAVWFAIAVTAVFASALAIFAQTWAQTHLTATRTAVIMTLEPAWALLFAVILAGQRLGAVQALGAALLLGAIVGHETLGRQRTVRSSSRAG